MKNFLVLLAVIIITVAGVFIFNNFNKYYDVTFILPEIDESAPDNLNMEKTLTIKVRPGTKIELPPTLENSDRLIFDGTWTTEDGEVVDFAEYKITEDTIFIPNFERKYLYTFILNDEVYYSCYAFANTPLSELDMPEPEETSFRFWESQVTGNIHLNGLNNSGLLGETTDKDEIFLGITNENRMNENSKIIGNWRYVQNNEDGTTTYAYLNVTTDLVTLSYRIGEGSELSEAALTNWSYMTEFNINADDSFYMAKYSVSLRYNADDDTLTGYLNIQLGMLDDPIIYTSEAIFTRMPA